MINDYSINETASRARLASKGAGYHWGLADEVYRSVFWLARYDLPALSSLSHLLRQYKDPDEVELSMPSFDQSNISALGNWLCPVMLGCALTDDIESISAHAPMTFSELVSPLLILPFVAEIAIKLKQVVVVELDSESVATDGIHIKFSDVDIATVEHVREGRMSLIATDKFEFNGDDKLQLHNRVQVDALDWQALDVFAHRTYAPATEASRKSGAGSGLTDND